MNTCLSTVVGFGLGGLVLSCAGSTAQQGADGGAGGTFLASGGKASGGTTAHASDNISNGGTTAAKTYCMPGDTRTCIGAGACAGGQLCDAAGNWSACDCGVGGSSALPMSSTGGALSAGGQLNAGGSLSTQLGSNTGGASTTGGAGHMNGTSPIGGTAAIGGATVVVAGASSLTGGGSTAGGGIAASGGTTSVLGTTAVGGINPTGGTSSTPVNTSPVGDACGLTVVPVPVPQMNLHVLLDKSGSLGYQTSSTAGNWDNCADRWNPIVDTLNGFFSQPDSSRLYASLGVFPADGDVTSICTPNSYATSAGLKVPLTMLDAAGRAQFQAKLCDCAAGTAPASTCIVPAGGTPTRAALQGTFDYAQSVATKYPDGQTVILLITDGMPSFYCGGSAPNGICNSCDDLTNGCYAKGTGCLDQSTEVDKISAVIQAESGSHGVNPNSIYVVGVGPDLNYSTVFEDWSAVSGNPGIDLRNLAGAQAAAAFLSALQSIRASFAVRLKIPASVTEQVEYASQINLQYLNGNGQVQDVRRTADGTVSTCSSVKLGWYFDKPVQPTEVLLCPAMNAAIQQDAKAQVQIMFGCPTQVF